MPKITPGKLFLIACVAGLAIAAASIGHAEWTDDTAPTRERTIARHRATPMCPMVHVRMRRPLQAFKSDYLAQTPVSGIAMRGDNLSAETI